MGIYIKLWFLKITTVLAVDYNQNTTRYCISLRFTKEKYLYPYQITARLRCLLRGQLFH